MEELIGILSDEHYTKEKTILREVTDASVGKKTDQEATIETVLRGGDPSRRRKKGKGMKG